MDIKNHAPEVSIIIPVYNTLKYLDKCLNSMIYQTLKNIEIIVIDDCSSEDIRNVINKYKHDYRIKYHRLEQRSNIGFARNYGMSLSKGKYITFCDSDDWVDLSTYEEMYNSLERTSSDVAMCSLYREYEGGNDILYKCFYDREFILEGESSFRIFTFEYKYEFPIVGQVTNKLYRRYFLEINNINYVDNAYYEDLDFNFKVFINNPKVITTPNVKFHHFKRIGSVIQSISVKHIREFYITFKSIKNCLVEKKLYNYYIRNYYAFFERFHNLIVRQIYEFEKDETKRKELLRESFKHISDVVNFDEFVQLTPSEKLRNHIQPYITDTIIK